MNDWLAAGIAIAGGIAVGIAASRLVGGLLQRSSHESLRASSAPFAGLALSSGVIIGLLVALGFVAPDQLSMLGDDTIAFLPKAISALVILIGANVVSTFAAAAVARSLAGAGAAARFAPLITKFSILVGGAIVAAGQTGVDTTVVNIAVAAVLFAMSGSVVLLTGLGGRQVAGEIAAGRAWRNSLQLGDRIEASIATAAAAEGSIADGAGTSATVSGTVVEVHPTSVELDAAGTTIFVPNSRLLASIVARERPHPADAEGTLESG